VPLHRRRVAYPSLIGLGNPTSIYEMKHLVDLILARDRNCSPGEVGLRCVELLEAAYESANHDGQPVDIA
jgi:predicted dehydrogenase